LNPTADLSFSELLPQSARGGFAVIRFDLKDALHSLQVRVDHWHGNDADHASSGGNENSEECQSTHRLCLPEELHLIAQTCLL
jgi:hypothetical protein